MLYARHAGERHGCVDKMCLQKKSACIFNAFPVPSSVSALVDTRRDMYRPGASGPQFVEGRFVSIVCVNLGVQFCR